MTEPDITLNKMLLKYEENNIHYVWYFVAFNSIKYNTYIIYKWRSSTVEEYIFLWKVYSIAGHKA